MTVPHVHCQPGEKAFSFRFCAWSLAAVATGCLTQSAVMPIWAQTRTVPPAAAPQSAAVQPVDARSAALARTPAFDVASIHPNNSDHTGRSHIYSYANQGHFVVENATPMQLLQYANNLPSSRILGVPGWATSTRYDIEAKSDPALAEKLGLLPYPDAKDQLLKMVQLFLADRFHLTAHIESRELPVYELVAAKDGVKFSPVKDGPKNIVDSNSRGGNVSMTITRSSHAMNDLADMLYRYTGRIVLDKTGLTGVYTISLTFTPDDSRSALPNPETTSAVDAGPSVFTALKEQLGLELKSSKGPVDVLVVDHMDPPTEN
jgi:uncharacterized protein (TIGR03435 family)